MLSESGEKQMTLIPYQQTKQCMIEKKYRLTIVIALFTVRIGILLIQKFNTASDPDELVLLFEDPIDYDFDEIKERGVIRLITRYSSVSYFLHHGIEHGFEYEFLSEFANEHG